MLEKRFAAFNARVTHGPWIEYYDQEGRGFAQPDAIVEGAGWIVVVECKRTFVEEALQKLEYFYKPLVQALYPSCVIYCVQVCKHLTPQARVFKPFYEPWELPLCGQPLAVYHLPLIHG